MKLENQIFEFDSFAQKMQELKEKKHFDYLVTIIGEDFGEEGMLFLLSASCGRLPISWSVRSLTSTASSFSDILICVVCSCGMILKVIRSARIGSLTTAIHLPMMWKQNMVANIR